MVFFPDSLDFFPFRRTREDHNASVVNNRISQDDILYMLNELQKKVGADGSTDSRSLDARLTALQNLLEETRSALTSAIETSGTIGKVSLPQFPIRANRVAVTTGGAVVRFSVPIAAGYILLAACYNTAGQVTGYGISGQTSEGFTVTPVEDGTFEWVVVSTL